MQPSLFQPHAHIGRSMKDVPRRTTGDENRELSGSAELNRWAEALATTHRSPFASVATATNVAAV